MRRISRLRIIILIRRLVEHAVIDLVLKHQHDQESAEKDQRNRNTDSSDLVE